MNEPVATGNGRPPLVVTWCSARKRHSVDVHLSDVHARAQGEVAADWRRLLSSAAAAATASDLYAGRAFLVARAAARRSGADLSVVSAGLGWVTSETRIPAYDLTIAGGSLASRVLGPLDVEAWWNSVKAGPFSTSPVRDLSRRPLILACVSQEYAAIFSAELERVPISRLRIFGAGLSRKLPTSLLAAVLPYDDRLDAVTGGTRADFAQRALQHFLFTLTTSGDIETDSAAVRKAMAALPTPLLRPPRQQRTDTEICALIESMLKTVGLRRTPMLRRLREKDGIACEQRRFARLFAEVTK